MPLSATWVSARTAAFRPTMAATSAAEATRRENRILNLPNNTHVVDPTRRIPTDVSHVLTMTTTGAQPVLFRSGGFLGIGRSDSPSRAATAVLAAARILLLLTIVPDSIVASARVFVGVARFRGRRRAHPTPLHLVARAFCDHELVISIALVVRDGDTRGWQRRV